MILAPENRKHPDVFTPEEAATYLHLDPDTGLRTLETLREKHELVGFQVGKGFMYHRRNLDALVERLFGIESGGKKGR
jgi:hypothetical protein